MSDEKQDQPQASADSTKPVKAKKPYSKPVITDYGSIAFLTRGSLHSAKDGAQGLTKQ